MSGLLCAGNVQIALLDDDGAFNGYMPVRNTVQLEIANGDNNEQTRTSKMIANYGTALDTVYAPGASTATIGIDDSGDADVVGMAFRGAVSALSQAAITSQDITLDVVKGVWYPVIEGVYNLTNVQVAPATGSGDPYVLGTDYDLDPEGGMVYIRPDGGIAAGKIKVTINAPELSGTRVTPGTKPTLRLRIFGRMQNLATGKPLIVRIPEMAAYPSNSVDFLSGNFAVSNFAGPIKSVNGQPPFTVDYL